MLEVGELRGDKDEDEGEGEGEQERAENSAAEGITETESAATAFFCSSNICSHSNRFSAQ